jgi:hypothetical protein
MSTWTEIKTALRNELWPFPTEAKTQIAVHDKWFLEGVIDIQNAIECLQERNTTVVEFTDLLTLCGKSVLESPPVWGSITSVFTIANDDWCDRIILRPTWFPSLEAWAKNNLIDFEASDEEVTEGGFQASNADTDGTCAGGRARYGFYALHRGKLYVAPWLQSNEKLVIEWDGVKSTWAGTDVLDDELWDAKVLQALRTYVEWKHACRFGDDAQEKRRLKQEWEDERADLIHRCREATAQKQDEVIETRMPTTEELEDDEVPEDEEVIPANAMYYDDGVTPMRYDDGTIMTYDD